MTTPHQAFQDLLAIIGSMGSQELLDEPHVILSIDIPIDEYDDPTDPGITFVIGPFPTATEAMAAAERHEKSLNAGSPKKAWRVIAVPLIAPDGN